MLRMGTLAILCLMNGVTANALAGEFDCVVLPRQVLEIRSPIDGLLDRIAVDRGAMVRKGQELAVIDSSVERLAMESARYRSAMQSARIAGESKARLETRKLARVQELHAKGHLPEQAEDEALNEQQLAEAELQEAIDNGKLAEIEYRRLAALIRLKTIPSPINGVVVERLLNVGEMVEAGVGRKPILKLADIEVLYVEALLPAPAYGQVKVGMTGDVSPAAPVGTTERATVTVVDRVLDAGSGTFGVRLELPNADARLLAGVRCKVSLSGVEATSGAPGEDAMAANSSRGTSVAPRVANSIGARPRR